jgi:hypothetical protein
LQPAAGTFASTNRLPLTNDDDRRNSIETQWTPATAQAKGGAEKD